MSAYVNPYETPGYKRHVERGRCPAISVTKSWCNLTAGHEGPHNSPRIPNPHQPKDWRNAAGVSWTEVLSPRSLNQVGRPQEDTPREA